MAGEGEEEWCRGGVVVFVDAPLPEHGALSSTTYLFIIIPGCTLQVG